MSDEISVLKDLTEEEKIELGNIQIPVSLLTPKVDATATVKRADGTIKN